MSDATKSPEQSKKEREVLMKKDADTGWVAKMAVYIEVQDIAYQNRMETEGREIRNQTPYLSAVKRELGRDVIEGLRTGRLTNGQAVDLYKLVTKIRQEVKGGKDIPHTPTMDEMNPTVSIVNAAVTLRRASDVHHAQQETNTLSVTVSASRQDVVATSAEQTAAANGVVIADATQAVMDKQFIENKKGYRFFVDWKNAPTEVSWYKIDRENQRLVKIPEVEAAGLEWHDRLVVYSSVLEAVRKKKPLTLYVGVQMDHRARTWLGLGVEDAETQFVQVGKPKKRSSEVGVTTKSARDNLFGLLHFATRKDIASNEEVDAAVIGGVIRADFFRTGTIVVYEAPNKPFGEAVEFQDITFNVPKEFRGIQNAALSFNLAPEYFALRREFSKRDLRYRNILSADEVNITLNFPVKRGWFRTDLYGLPSFGEGDAYGVTQDPTYSHSAASEYYKNRHYLVRRDEAYIGAVVRTPHAHFGRTIYLEHDVSDTLDVALIITDPATIMKQKAEIDKHDAELLAKRQTFLSLSIEEKWALADATDGDKEALARIAKMPLADLNTPHGVYTAIARAVRRAGLDNSYELKLISEYRTLGILPEPTYHDSAPTGESTTNHVPTFHLVVERRYNPHTDSYEYYTRYEY